MNQVNEKESKGAKGHHDGGMQTASLFVINTIA